MRKFERPLVVCSQCSAKLHTWLSWPGERGENVLEAKWTEPPQLNEKCPRCGAIVDTSNAYTHIAGLQTGIEQLKNAYKGFTAKGEMHRQSFERNVSNFLDKSDLQTCKQSLNNEEGFQWFRQRMFYRSAAGFYRSLQL